MVKVPSSGLTLLVGGARSGKSDLAVRLANDWPGEVTFVATATAGDEEMVERIEKHRSDRPDHWRLIEEPTFGSHDVGDVADGDLLIVDCLTMLINELLFAGFNDRAVDAHMCELATELNGRSGPTMVVTNEVGLGIVPDNQLSRRYRDLLGRANRSMADRSRLAAFVVAGRALPLESVSASWCTD